MDTMDAGKAQRKAALQEIASLPGHADRAWSVAWHPTQPILASSSTDKQIRLYKYQAVPSTSASLFEFHYLDSIPTGHTRTVRAIEWSPEGQLLASGSFDSTVSIWTNHRYSSLDLGLDKKNIPSTTTSRWEREVEADVERDKEERDWESVLSLEGHESEVKGLAWNRNGKLLATSSRDKSVWVWEILGTGEQQGEEEEEEAGYEVLSVLMDHDADVKSVCWSPVEDLLCSTSYDHNVHLYAEDTTSDGDFTLVHKLSGHSSTVWEASFSPCGEFLASCSDDLSIRIWRREKIGAGGVEGRDGGKSGGWRIGRSERERWICLDVIEGFHKRTIYSLDWTFFGENIKGDEGENLGVIATAAGDGKINLFEIHRGISVSGLDVSSPKLEIQLIAQRNHAHGVSDVNAVRWCKVSASEKSSWRKEARAMLASAGDDGVMKVWRLS